MVKEILSKEKIVFIKCSDYMITIDYLFYELSENYEIILITDKNSFTRKVESVVGGGIIFSAINSPNKAGKACIITTEMLNNFNDNELVSLYIIKKNTNNFYWIDIGEELSSRKIEKVVKVIDFSKQEREIYFQHLKTKMGEKYKGLLPYIKNMPLKSINDFLMKYKTTFTTEEIAYLKADILSDSLGIERIKEKVLIEHVGGCHNYKNWINKIATVRNKYDGKTISFLPKGAVLLGWTGTGKSYLAKMTATCLGLPLFKFDLGMVMNRYVGESEKRMKEFLEKIQILSPCVVWLDEMDKFFVNWEKEDTGVIARLLGEFLYFLQENKSDVFFIATINNFEQLPIELIRKGRFATMWYVNLPDQKARIEILKIYLNNTFFENLSEKQYIDIANITEGFTPAEICSCVDELKLDALYTEKRITFDKIVKHFKLASRSIDLQKTKYEKFLDFIEKQKIMKV